MCRQATTAKFGNRKRRRVGSEEPHEGETEADREKRKRHKERARLRMEAEEDLMQSPMYQRFMSIINGIMEAFEEAVQTINVEEEDDDQDECPAELLISQEKLADLCAEVAKLKASKGLHLVSMERIVRVLNALERNVRDASRLTPYLDEEAEGTIGDGEEDRMWRDVVMERVLRSADAALAALNIMCAPKMPKQVFVEDVIERCVKYAKFQLQNTIYPDYDPVYRSNNKGSSTMKQKRAKAAAVKNKHSIHLYNKMSQTIKLLAELSDQSELTDTIVLQISSLGVSAFFVENIPDLQLSAIQLVTSIFSRYPKHRQLILDDILSSLARLPSSKKSLRNYKINSEDCIQMMSGLVLQLMQSVVQLPEVEDESSAVDEDIDDEELRRRRKRKVDNDVFIEQSYTQALQVAHNFLARFLQKCGMKGEEDFRPLFENFVQDLLTAVNKPEWPAAEVMLWLLGSLLISQFGNKSIDMSLRISSIDYLGIIASRLRKDALHSNVNQRAVRALMEILSATDDPNFDEEVKAEEALAEKEGRLKDDDDDDDEKSDEEGKRKSRLNVGNMGESGSDSSLSEDEGDDDENFGDDDDPDGEERKRRTPKKKKRKKKKGGGGGGGEGGKDSKTPNGDGVNGNGGGTEHDAKVKNMRSELRTSVLQSGLLAYLRGQGDSEDPTYTYAQRFYLAQWFKDAQDEAKVALSNKNKSAKKVRDEINVNSDDDEEVVAAERANHQEEIDELEKHSKSLRDAEERKQRMLSMAAEFIKGRPSWDRSKLDYKDASLATCYLSTQRTFGQSFELYLKKILRVLGETAIAVRTKAMKCLAAVVESDPGLLERVDMQQGVQARFLDSANSVREAAVDLIGRFVMIRPSLTERYYPMIQERILDTGVSVRKRVIKILRDICIEQPEFSKNTEICVRMIRRVHDEEGIKKLVSEVFENMWFTAVTPKRGFGTKDSELKAQVKAKMAIKILQLTDVVHACTAEAGGAAGLEWLEALVASLLKREEDVNDEALAAALLAAPGGANNKKPPRDSASTTLAREELIHNYQSNVGPVLKACQQLVDALIEHVIDLDLEISTGPSETTKTTDDGESDKEKVNGFKESDESDQSKEDIRIGDKIKPSEARRKTAKLISCFSALNLFTRVKPKLMSTHAITLAPYLESFDADTAADNAIINDVTSILEDVIPLMEHPSETFLSEVEEKLMKNVFSRPQSVIPNSVSCLASLVNQVTHNFKFIKDSLMSIYNNLKNGAKRLKNREPGLDAKLPSLRRDLFTLGLFCKHFSFSDLGFPENTEEQILNTFLYYIHQKAVRDEELKARALDGVGFFCATHYKLMLGKQIRDLYSCLLTKPGKELVRSKLQVLRNMQSYLQEEENRQTKEERAYKKKLKEELLAKEAGMKKKGEGADSLKEINDIQSGMASTIIQVYIKEINGCFHSAYKPIRLCALEVLCLILNQGLIHPVQSVPYLISAATDQDHTIAVKAEKQLADIDQKYPGFIQMKALQGVRLSYDLQVLHKKILQYTNEEKSRKIILRGLRVDANSGSTSACLAPVYNHLRGNKAHRRAFLTSLLYLFEDSSTALLQEKIYICDNLAYFPYQQQYEPLFMIHQIDLIVSVSGANLLQAFKEHLTPKPGDENSNPETANGEEAPRNNGDFQKTREEVEIEERAWQERERELESRGEFDRLEEEREARERRKRALEEERRQRETKLAYDDEDDDLELLASRIPDRAEQLVAIYHSWQGCVLLLILKQFLKDYYGITEARIQSYSPQDGSKVNDKPLNRRQGVERFNPAPALAILQKGDPEYPLSDEAKEDLANEYGRFKNLMLQLDPADEQEFDPEAPDDPGRLQKTSANAFKEYMAQRVDPNTGIVPVFSRPNEVAGAQDKKKKKRRRIASDSEEEAATTTAKTPLGNEREREKRKRS